MWMPKQGVDKGQELVAVAIDKDKNSQSAIKWAIDNVLQRGQTVILIHVNVKTPTQSTVSSHYPPRVNQIADSSESSLLSKNPNQQTIELFLPFRCFCTRKDIKCKDIVLEDLDVGRALVEYVSQTAIETLILGATTKTGFLRFKANDIPNSVLKGAPDFCSVYVISKMKVQSTRVATCPAPFVSPLRSQLQSQSKSLPTRAPAPIEANVSLTTQQKRARAKENSVTILPSTAMEEAIHTTLTTLMAKMEEHFIYVQSELNDLKTRLTNIEREQTHVTSLLCLRLVQPECMPTPPSTCESPLEGVLEP